MRDHLRWFDERPLFGRRIVVTRSQEQAQRARRRSSRTLGAQAIQAPTFRLAPPDDPEALDRAAASVDDYQWVVFESANAVTRFLSALARGPRDLRALGGASDLRDRPVTAERLWRAASSPTSCRRRVRRGEHRRRHRGQGADRGPRVLVDPARPPARRRRRGPRAPWRGRHRSRGLPHGRRVADSPAAQELYRLLLEGRIDAVTFTSPTAVERFASLIGEEQAADLLNTTVVATIGPVTAAAATEMGIKNPLVADTYTVDGLVAGAGRPLRGAKRDRGPRAFDGTRERRARIVPVPDPPMSSSRKRRQHHVAHRPQAGRRLRALSESS